MYEILFTFSKIIISESFFVSNNFVSEGRCVQLAGFLVRLFLGNSELTAIDHLQAAK